MQNVCVNNKLKNEVLNKDILEVFYQRLKECSSNIIPFECSGKLDGTLIFFQDDYSFSHT